MTFQRNVHILIQMKKISLGVDMKRLESVETDLVSLEVGECDCGYHFSVDATFLEQVRDFTFRCPSCNKIIDTAIVFPEGES
jgi:hypothetical protein